MIVAYLSFCQCSRTISSREDRTLYRRDPLCIGEHSQRGLGRAALAGHGFSHESRIARVGVQHRRGAGNRGSREMVGLLGRESDLLRALAHRFGKQKDVRGA